MKDYAQQQCRGVLRVDFDNVHDEKNENPAHLASKTYRTTQFFI